MNKLEIPDPQFFTVSLYSPDDVLIGTIFTETQFYEIRCQILEKKLGYGYYFIYNNEKMTMDEFGRIKGDEIKNNPFKYDSYLNRLMS